MRYMALGGKTKYIYIYTHIHIHTHTHRKKERGPVDITMVCIT